MCRADAAGKGEGSSGIKRKLRVFNVPATLVSEAKVEDDGRSPRYPEPPATKVQVGRGHVGRGLEYKGYKR